MSTIKQDKETMSALNVSEIRRIICDTDKGLLSLVLKKNTDEYFLMLDAVHLDKETNKTIMELLFPRKVEIPQVNKEFIVTPIDTTVVLKKKGRPKKIK